MKECGIPWKVCAVSIRDVVAREQEHKQKIQESPSFGPNLRTITNSAIYDLGRSWLFGSYFFFFFSFYNCFKEEQWKQNSNFFKQ